MLGGPAARRRRGPGAVRQGQAPPSELAEAGRAEVRAVGQLADCSDSRWPLIPILVVAAFYLPVAGPVRTSGDRRRGSWTRPRTSTCSRCGPRAPAAARARADHRRPGGGVAGGPGSPTGSPSWSCAPTGCDCRPDEGVRHSGRMPKSDKRRDLITGVLDDAFAPLMKADPQAFRVKFRKMAERPALVLPGERLPLLRRCHRGGGPVRRRPLRRGSGSTATCTWRTSAPT